MGKATMVMPPSRQDQPLGDRAFASLQAEHEAPWLPQVYVEPEEFQHMVGMRSIVVFGDVGAGKTALYYALTSWAKNPTLSDRLLIVDWRPVIDSELSPEAPLRGLDTQMLSACANELVEYIKTNPDNYIQAPHWAQEMLSWFIQTYLAGDKSRYANRLASEVGAAYADLMRGLLQTPASQIHPKDVPPQRVLKELTHAIEKLHLQGIWVIIDGIDVADENELNSYTSALKQMLSTLALFEIPRFAMKLLLSCEFEPAVMNSSSIRRRRLDDYSLNWLQHELEQIVERRLSYALGKPDLTLADICADTYIRDLLVKYGGSAPRGWLDLLKPFISAYLRQKPQQTLGQLIIEQIKDRNPPRLRIDPSSRRVFLGYAERAILQQGLFNILAYLYNRNRTCSREELYYLAYRGLSDIPKNQQDRGWEDSSSWPPTFDNLIYRLRKEIEPDPNKPRYIVTVRKQGIILRHAW